MVLRLQTPRATISSTASSNSHLGSEWFRRFPNISILIFDPIGSNYRAIFSSFARSISAVPSLHKYIRRHRQFSIKCRSLAVHVPVNSPASSCGPSSVCVHYSASWRFFIVFRGALVTCNRHSTTCSEELQTFNFSFCASCISQFQDKQSTNSTMENTLNKKLPPTDQSYRGWRNMSVNKTVCRLYKASVRSKQL